MALDVPDRWGVAGTVAATVATALLVAACGPEDRTTYCYGQVALDVATLRLRPIHPLAPDCPRDSTSAYWRLDGAYGRVYARTVYH